MGFARCEHCQTEFPQKTSRRRFCSDRCQMAAWQCKRQAREDRLRRLVKVQAKAAGLTPEDLA